MENHNKIKEMSKGTSSKNLCMLLIFNQCTSSSPSTSPSSFVVHSSLSIVSYLPFLDNKKHKKHSKQHLSSSHPPSSHRHLTYFFCIILIFVVFYKWIHEPGGT